MNCTARRSASANHFMSRSRRPCRYPFAVVRRLRTRTRLYLQFASASTCKSQADRLHCGTWQALRPVLPDRARPRPRRRALVAARRPRAACTGRSATRPRTPGCPALGTNILAARLKELEAGGHRREAEAAAAGRVDGLRAHRRPARELAARAARARALGRPLARAAAARRRSSPTAGS